jgi:heavy metal-binding protein
VVLRVKRLRADWQTPFVFRRPIARPAGTVLEAVASYDEKAADGRSPVFTVTMTRYDEPARVALVAAHEPQPPAIAPPTDNTTAWFCPMHPDVTASEEGRCRKCGMTLVAGRPFDTRNYLMEVGVSPVAIKPGVPFHLRFDIRHPSTAAAVRNFEVVHDKRYHLFVVSHDMEVFQHIHPDQQPDGSWTVETTVPKAGAYRVVSDFLPTGGAPQLLARTLVTAGFDGDLRSQDAHLQPDSVLKKTVGPLTAEVRFEPAQLVAGEYGHLEFTVTDSKSGEPVTDLQPYLGAFGHAFILSEDLRDSVHSHPPEWRDGKEITSGLGGPTVMFEGYMPRPGRYRIWAQFLRRGELTTIPFTFEVTTLDAALGRRP